MKTLPQVLTSFETAALNAGLSRNTRKTYAPVIAEYTEMLIARKITGVQDYVNHLSSVPGYAARQDAFIDGIATRKAQQRARAAKKQQQEQP